MKTPISRRHLLKTAAISTALSALPAPLLAAERPALAVPPLIDGRRGRPIVLNMQETKFPLDGKNRVDVWGFNGNYLGPTIKVKSGGFAKLNYYNNLNQAVALTVQGLQASGELFSGAARLLKQDSAWSPIVPINQTAATCWYHAGTLANAAYQTYRGLVGMWIVEDDESRKAELPHQYGINDIPLILQDMEFNAQGQQLFKQNHPQFAGNRLLVNGQEAPYLNVPRGWVRLRLLNASIARRYQLRFDDDRPFWLLAQDLAFLPESVELTTLSLAPSERCEILVDLNEGGNVSLIEGHKRNFFSKISTLFNDNELADNTVLELRPQGELSVFNRPPARRFQTETATENQAVGQRRFHLDTTNATLNNQRFDPRRIDVQAKLHSVERWILTASQPVGFCIQGAKFTVVPQGQQGKPQTAQPVWKDTVWIEGETHILVQFDQPSSHNYPFTFGTSNLMLADMGCMGVLIVQ